MAFFSKNMFPITLDNTVYIDFFLFWNKMLNFPSIFYFLIYIARKLVTVVGWSIITEADYSKGSNNYLLLRVTIAACSAGKKLTWKWFWSALKLFNFSVQLAQIKFHQCLQYWYSYCENKIYFILIWKFHQEKSDSIQ